MAILLTILYFQIALDRNLRQEYELHERILQQEQTPVDAGVFGRLTANNNTSSPVVQDHSFSTCLLMMDDNHFLVEWLAYHYTVLPLRRLIVTMDRKSTTDARPIFQRWQGLMNMTIASKIPNATITRFTRATLRKNNNNNYTTFS